MDRECDEVAFPVNLRKMLHAGQASLSLDDVTVYLWTIFSSCCNPLTAADGAQ